MDPRREYMIDAWAWADGLIQGFVDIRAHLFFPYTSETNTGEGNEIVECGPLMGWTEWQEMAFVIKSYLHFHETNELWNFEKSVLAKFVERELHSALYDLDCFWSCEFAEHVAAGAQDNEASWHDVNEEDVLDWFEGSTEMHDMHLLARLHGAWMDHDEVNPPTKEEANAYFFQFRKLNEMKSPIQWDCGKERISRKQLKMHLNRRNQSTIMDSITSEAKEETSHGFVYFAKSKLHDFVKIGYSKQPKLREKTLQAEDPMFRIVSTRHGTMKDERQLHQMFSDKRIRGEWFDVEIEEAINAFDLQIAAT